MSTPKFQGIDVVYKSKADNKDIRNLLEKLVPEGAKQVKDYSNQFKSNSELNSCKKIFGVLKGLNYVADAEEQIIKLPSALLKKGVGDCKSFALLTASILENLNIPYKFVYASYNSNPIPQHVYVVTQSGIIIDAVYGTFNKEKKPTYKYTKNMNVRYMAGIGCTSCGGSCKNKNHGVGNIFTDGKKAIQDAANSVKAKASQAQDSVKAKASQVKSEVKQGSKTIALSSGRGLFLVMLNNNIDGIASKISSTGSSALMDKWYSLGGNRTTLANAIKNGSSKPEKKIGFLSKLKALVGSQNISGIGEIPTDLKAKIIALCVSAGTAIGSAIPTVGTAAGASAGAVLGTVVTEILPTVINAVRKVPTSDNGSNPITQPSNINTDGLNDVSGSSGGSDIFENVKKYAPYAIGLGILGYVAYNYKNK